MKNRRSALEARKRQKQKEETLHSDYLRLNEENYSLQQQNDYYQNLLEKYLRHGVSRPEGWHLARLNQINLHADYNDLLLMAS